MTLYLGDVRDVLDRLVAEGQTADLAVTSPPFLALRSYLPADHPDKHRELGSEPTPAAFLDGAFGWTAQLGQLIPEWGSICVELGDTMSGSGGAGGDYTALGLRANQPLYRQSRDAATRGSRRDAKHARGGDDEAMRRYAAGKRDNPGPGWPLAKSMCLVPHAYTIGLAYGMNPLTGQPTPAGQWRIRNVITWARPNPPVGSLGKRNPERRTGDYKFRPACSFITVACRGTGRYFDLDAVRTSDADPPRLTRVGIASASKGVNGGDSGNPDKLRLTHNPAGAPPLDWHTDDLDGDWLWKLATAPYKGAHYATFNLTLPRRLILAMCPERVCTVCGWPSERVTVVTGMVDGNGREVARSTWASGMLNGKGAHSDKPNSGTTTTVTLGWTDCGHDTWRPGRVIDIFGGSGTTAVAAALEGRDAVLIDLDVRNVDLVRRRLTDELRIISERRDGDVITWTVETRAPNQNGQVEGQTSLLDLFGV